MEGTRAKPQTPKNSLLQKKVAKILQHDLENDKETLEALASLSHLISDNTPDERRMIRSSIEKQSLTINSQFLSSFTKIKDLLDDLYADAAIMNETCTRLLSQVRAEKEKDVEIIAVLESLKLDETADLLSLTPEQESVLIEEGVSEAFFHSLERLKQIHTDAKEILMTGGNENQIALQAMEKTSLMTQAAMEKLYRWSLTALRSCSLQDEDHASLISKSLAVLDQEKPELLDHCLEEYRTVRRLAVVRNFIDALTMSKTARSASLSGHGSRAMDSYMNDAVRFVSDILTWISNMMSNEEKSLTVMLQSCTSCNMGDKISPFLTFVTDGLCTPLKSRFESVILLDHDKHQQRRMIPVVLYHVKCLISFYVYKYDQVLLLESILLYTLKDLLQLADKMFDNTLTYNLSEIGKQGFELTEGLRPEDQYSHAVRLLHQIISLCQGNPVCRDREEMYNIVAKIMDSLFFYLKNVSDCMQGVEGKVYLLNCLDALTYVIGGLDGLGEGLDRLQCMTEETVQKVTGEQVSYIVQFLGLRTIHDRLIDGDCSAPLSSVPGCDAVSLSNACASLDQLLADPESVLMPSLVKVTNAGLRDKIFTEAKVLFLSIYTSVYEAVADPDQGYEEVRTLLTRDPDQVKALLL